MYPLSDQQTDYILSDIRRRGVEMEDLQLNLLDHICCLIEQNLKEGEDFEAFYKQTIPKFFKHELWEIEQETITLLTFKNYYAMKKTMITSGAVAVIALLGGSFFKIMHWPGAGVMLVFGIGILCFLFLPLMFLLKAREASGARDKLVAGLGTLVGILLCLSTLFKLMHWPGATMLWLTTSAVSIFLFVPIYFFSGIRRAESKVNTIVTTIILVGATGLLFSLTAVRKSAKLTFLETKTFYKNEQLLKDLRAKAVVNEEKNHVYAQIHVICDKLKSIILMENTGVAQLPADFESQGIVIYEGGLGEAFRRDGEAVKLMHELKSLVTKYNSGQKQPAGISLDNTIFEGKPEGIFIYSNLAVLNALNQLQMMLAASEIKT